MIEFYSRPLYDAPKGSVTSGLPYPFLNDMIVNERLVFYATTVVTTLIFFGIAWALAAGLRRLGK